MAKGTSAKKIVIIGAGHMGTALAKGLARSGIAASSIALIDKGDSIAPIAHARIVFLAVKPAIIPEALVGTRHLLKGKLVVSVAAGVTVAQLRKNLDASTRVARMMPNIPVAVNEGVVGVFIANASAREGSSLRNSFPASGSSSK